MHSGAALTAAVGQAPQVPFVGLTYRSIHLKHFPTLVAAQPLFAPAGGLIGSRYVAPGRTEVAVRRFAIYNLISRAERLVL